jgi:hypothetical protein
MNMALAGIRGHWNRAMVILIGLGLAGCAWSQPKAPPPAEKMDAGKSVTLRVPPKDLVKKIQDVLPASLQLPIADVHDGTIVTDWKEYEGAIHIVRRWREKTRFKIVISPDFNDPTGTSHVEVFDETEEKPSDPQPWYPNPTLRRPERADEVLKELGRLNS